MGELVTIGARKADLEIADGRLVVRDRRSEQLVADADLSDVQYQVDGGSVRLIIDGRDILVRPEFMTAAELHSYLERAGEEKETEPGPPRPPGEKGRKFRKRGAIALALVAAPIAWAMILQITGWPDDYILLPIGLGFVLGTLIGLWVLLAASLSLIRRNYTGQQLTMLRTGMILAFCAVFAAWAFGALISSDF